MPEGLQLILGADEKNQFTVYKDKNTNSLHIYVGAFLHEVIKNDKKNPEFKMALARLYNSGVQVKTLIQHFGFSYPTYQRWGEALKSGDMERIYWAFSGQGGGGKKLTPDIIAFIVHDFEHVYLRNKYSYSKEILQDVKEVYNVELSAETIRPLLKDLKGNWHKGQELSDEEKKRIYKNYLQ